MKKIAGMLLTILLIFVFYTNNVVVSATEEVIDNTTESKLVEIKENETKTIQDYQEKYGSKAYGTVAYILHLIQIYNFTDFLCIL